MAEKKSKKKKATQPWWMSPKGWMAIIVAVVAVIAVVVPFIGRSSVQKERQKIERRGSPDYFHSSLPSPPPSSQCRTPKRTAQLLREGKENLWGDKTPIFFDSTIDAERGFGRWMRSIACAYHEGLFEPFYPVFVGEALFPLEEDCDKATMEMIKAQHKWFECVRKQIVVPFPVMFEGILSRGKARVVSSVSNITVADASITKLTTAMRKELHSFNEVFVGSTYARNVMAALNGVENAAVVNVGVRCPSLPMKQYQHTRDDGRFVVYSEGILDYQRGHDLVALAVRLLQEQRGIKAELLANWRSDRPDISQNLQCSPYSEWGEGSRELLIRRQKGQMNGLYSQTRKSPSERVNREDAVEDDVNFLLYDGILPPHQLSLLVDSLIDVAVYVNRCAGGLDNSAMEMMARGVPVIILNHTSYTDFMSIQHESGKNFTYSVHPTYTAVCADDDNQAGFLQDRRIWPEPHPDDIVVQLAKVYNEQRESERVATRGAEVIRKYYCDADRVPRLRDALRGVVRRIAEREKTEQ